MDFSITAISVKSIDYGDNGRLVTLVTPFRGKIIVKASGCKSLKSKLRIPSMPFCYGDYYLREKSGKVSMISCDIVQSFGSFGEDLDKFYLASIVMETAEKFFLEEQEDKELFELVLSCCQALKNSDYPGLLILNYLVKLLKVEGYDFTSNYEVNPYLDFEVGGIVEKEKKGRQSVALSKNTAKLLTQIIEDGEVDIPDQITIKEAFTNMARFYYYVCGQALQSIKAYITI